MSKQDCSLIGADAANGESQMSYSRFEVGLGVSKFFLQNDRFYLKQIDLRSA